ncbi:PDZ domain-containing protein [Nocardioides korecus]
MRRHSWAALLAAALLVVLAVVAAALPVPFVTFSPGPTVNVLGKYDGKPIISVQGRRTYTDGGALRLVTIIPSGPSDKVSLPEMVAAWLDPDRSVYPYDAIYAKQDTRASVKEQSGQQMVSSQDNAVAAALGVLKIPFSSVTKIAAVTTGGPADGHLRVGDVVVSANGRPVSSLESLTKVVRPLAVGSPVTMVVRRDGRRVTERMRTTSAPDDAKASALRVAIGAGYEFPFRVKIGLDQNIGGPSGGLMFAMSIYDVLTPGSLTDGKSVAGTGEIDAQGKVGVIGGIQQKLVGAQDDGARLFLVPAGNCAEALDGHYDPDKLRLVKVNTLAEAIKDVKAWTANPDAKLTRCTK